MGMTNKGVMDRPRGRNDFFFKKLFIYLQHKSGKRMNNKQEYTTLAEHS